MRLLPAFAVHYLRWLLRSPGRRRPRPRVRSEAEHRAAVEHLQETMSRPGPYRLVKRGAGHQTAAREQRTGTELDLRSLDAILAVDPHTPSITVEAQVTVAELVHHSAGHGLAPRVVPEFPSITVGGGIQGLAAESSSHRCGLFHDSLLWMDVVLGNGRLIRVSAAEHSELWHALPGSYGTIAVVVRACLELAPRLPHVRLMHRRARVHELVADSSLLDHDFVDAICVRDDEIVVTTGDLTAEVEAGVPLRRPRFWTAYYCDRVMRTPGNAGPELMTFEDYVFRYDRGAFWIAPTKLGRSLASRILFGGFATADNLYRWRRTKQRLSDRPSNRLVQDFMVPAARVEQWVRVLRASLDGPLWLLPMTSPSDTLFGPQPGPYVNVGAYLRTGLAPDQHRRLELRLEQELARLDGRKVLHAEVFYTPGQLAGIYDLERYDRVREAYGAVGAFPHLVDKLGLGRDPGGIVRDG